MLPPKKGSFPVKANPASSGQVDGAINAFVKNKKNMAKKTKKRVAARLKAMKAGGK